MNENSKKFINNLVIDYSANKLSDHDIQDIIEAYCISNNHDFEKLSKLFYLKISLISAVLVIE